MDLEKKDIIHLHIDVGILNNLSAEGINTIGDLLKLSETDILKIPGIGGKSLIKIQDALIRFRNENTNKNDCNFEQLENLIGNKIHQTMRQYFETNGQQHVNSAIQSAFNNLRVELENKLFSNINEMRTLILEQGRILEGVQAITYNDGVINKISEKIPGFNKIMHDLYKKLYKTK